MKNEAYGRRWKRLGRLDGFKEGFQVAITGLIVRGVFIGVDNHGSEPSTVELPHGLTGCQGVLSGTEVLVKSVPYGSQYGSSQHAHVHEF